MRAVILTFHAIRRGLGYAENDHTAFAEVLRQLTNLEIPVRPMHQLVSSLSNPILRWRMPSKYVVLSCDDGERSEVDATSAEDGSLVPSFAETQRRFVGAQQACGGVPHLTSFVIADESARRQICPDGVLDSDWWRASAGSALAAIENHSWDHCHSDVTHIQQRAQTKGTFRGIDTYEDADVQIKRSARTIDAIIAPHKTSLFAYPYGDTNDYLLREYFPQFQHEHRMRAALTTEPAPVTQRVNRWAIPRYVCGHHWKSDEEFLALLRDANLLGRSA